MIDSALANRFDFKQTPEQSDNFVYEACKTCFVANARTIIIRLYNGRFIYDYIFTEVFCIEIHFSVFTKTIDFFICVLGRNIIHNSVVFVKAFG